MFVYFSIIECRVKMTREVVHDIKAFARFRPQLVRGKKIYEIKQT